ncbi:phage tail protein [Kribbella sp. CA-293567]|uniref:phage tail protein n=1 Tax=Kribbella sp. CA-293567 TaxID=3002436 RepID=UPI0022DD841D|nr:phage tail protein [Kribbella sp. CA-293567]WBQ06497.1 phage tail protein [Kribbella sp. CA-293567]
MTMPGMSMAAGAAALVTDQLGSKTPGGGSLNPRPYGMTMWFRVLVPALDGGAPTSLGLWSGCSGLTVQLTPEGPFDEGGNYTSARHLPGKITYPKVVLERAMTADGAAAVRKWLEDQAVSWVGGQAPQTASSGPVVIEMHSGPGRNDAVIHRWELTNAVPVEWAVPALTTSGSGGIALEKLALVHGGFLKPVEQVHRLELIEKGNAAFQLQFLHNPDKVEFERSREAESKHATALTQAVVVDPNSLKITLANLRLEGCAQVEAAVPVLSRWIELDTPQGSGQPAGRPKPAEGTDAPACPSCGRTKPSPADATAAGTPRVLRVVWGEDRGGMPPEMMLKSYTLTFTRFTPAGKPSRATVKLTLQEYRPQSSAGRKGSPPPARGRQPASGSPQRPSAPAPSSAPPAAGRSDDPLRSATGGRR